MSADKFSNDSHVNRRLVLFYKSTDTSAPVVISRVDRQPCRAWLTAPEEPTIHEWVLPFHSAVGSELIKIAFTPSQDNKGYTLSSGTWRVLSNATYELPSDQLREVCLAAQRGDESFTVQDDRIARTVLKWLGHLSPDCEMAINQKYGPFCTMDQDAPDLVESELRDLRRTMIRRWSRQPYLFTRRLALTIQLAEALQANNSLLALDRICNVIQISDPIEVPLAMASKRWQDAVCIKVSGVRREAASVGMTKAFAEVEFLRQLFERTSRLGILSVKIPRQKLPTKDLWISLIPESDVAQKLKAESRSLGSSDINAIAGEFSNPKSCWHPLFSSNSETMQIARQLDLTGSKPGISCLDQKIDHEKVDQYFADNITSETEFVLTNGRSKILRLPIGKYRYILQGHSETLGYSPVSDIKSTGTIAWNGRRGGAKITTWN